MSDYYPNFPQRSLGFNFSIILFVVIGFLIYEFWSGGFKIPQFSIFPSSKSSNQTSKEKTPPDYSGYKTYTDEKLGFTFSYPPSLRIYTGNDEIYIESWFTNGEPFVPGQQVFLEEADRSSSTRNRVVVSLVKNDAKESLPTIVEKVKNKACVGVWEEDPVAVFDATIGQIQSKKIVCGRLATAFVIPDHYTNSRYVTIVGTLSDMEKSKVKIFNEELEVLANSYKFTLGVNSYINDSIRNINTRSIMSSLELFYIDNNYYPVSTEKLVPKYIRSLPSDPISKALYNYKIIKGGQDYQVCANFETEYKEKIKVGLNCFSSPK